MEELLCVRVKLARKDEMAIKESEKKKFIFTLLTQRQFFQLSQRAIASNSTLITGYDCDKAAFEGSTDGEPINTEQQAVGAQNSDTTIFTKPTFTRPRPKISAQNEIK